jgi:hypothetical protein
MRKFLLPALLLGVSTFAAAGPVAISCKGPDDLNKWAELWRKADGAEYQEAGLGLSECLVTEDDLFFRAMFAQKGIFDGWLQGLGSHTFTVFEPSQKAHIVKLRKQMLSIAKRKLSDPKYGSLAKAVATQVAKTPIREVD